MNKKQLIFLTIFWPTLSACGNLNSIHRNLNVNSGTGAFVDVKQRAVIVKKDNEEKTIVCAEPSPDALSAYAAELAAKLSKPGVGEAGLALAARESAAFIGVRTQSIQLLRDGMFRLCEARLNGMTEENYAHQMRRYQRNMVALMAIEQLAGVVKAPAVTISAESQASAARSISSLREEITKIDTIVSAKEKHQTELKAKGTNITDAEKKELEQLNIDIKTLASDKESISKAIENAKGLVAGGNLSAVVVSNTQSQQSVSTEIALNIKELTSEILRQDDTPFLCFDLLRNYSFSDKLTLVAGDNNHWALSSSSSPTPKDLLALRCLDHVASKPISLVQKLELFEKLYGPDNKKGEKANGTKDESWLNFLDKFGSFEDQLGNKMAISPRNPYLNNRDYPG
ncbi:hypothetical protein MACH10_12910 [Thalassospira tepidiphila]|nr:hypothetical protein MACH10_12910 [Thalassospira tepidiphila]